MQCKELFFFFPVPSETKLLTCCHITSTSFSAYFLQIRIFSYFNVLTYIPPNSYWGFPDGTVAKNLLASAGDTRDSGLIPGSGRSPGVGDSKLLHPVFLPGKFLGQRSLAGSSGRKELDTTEQQNTHI